MTFVHLDNPGEIRWFSGYGPRRVLGACPHPNCKHHATSVVAWGPDARRYELADCDAECGGNCRAWMDGRGVVTTSWLAVEAEVQSLVLRDGF